MILIGLGGNIPSSAGAPTETLVAALAMLGRLGVHVVQQSKFYSSPSWPVGAGPDFVNAVADITTKLAPAELMRVLLSVESAHGRVRRVKWGPRTLDLDILDFHGLVTDADHLMLPHPWIEDRAFVLKPLLDVAPNWRHPVTGQSGATLLADLDRDQLDGCKLVSPP